MSGIISAAGAIDPVLQGLWVDMENDPQSYKGFLAAPPVPHKGLSGQYLKSNKVLRLNLDATDDPYDRTQDMPVHAQSRPVGRSFTTDSFQMKRRSDSAFVPLAIKNHIQAAHGFDLVESELRDLWHIHRGIHEYDVFTDVYSTAANFTTSTDPGSYLTTTTDYLAPALVATRAVQLGCGRRANFAFMPRVVANALMQNDDVKSSIAAGSDAQFVTPEALVAWHRGHLGVELVIVDSTFENSSGSAAETMGNHIAFVYLNDQPDGKGFATTFLNEELTQGLDTDTPVLSGVTSEEIFDPKGTKIIAEMFQVVKVTNPNAGYLLTDVLS